MELHPWAQHGEVPNGFQESVDAGEEAGECGGVQFSHFGINAIASANILDELQPQSTPNRNLKAMLYWTRRSPYARYMYLSYRLHFQMIWFQKRKHMVLNKWLWKYATLSKSWAVDGSQTMVGLYPVKSSLDDDSSFYRIDGTQYIIVAKKFLA